MTLVQKFKQKFNIFEYVSSFVFSDLPQNSQGAGNNYESFGPEAAVYESYGADRLASPDLRQPHNDQQGNKMIFPSFI